MNYAIRRGAVTVTKRKIFGPFYGPLVRANSSRPIRVLKGSLIWPSQAVLARRTHPCFSVDISGEMGFGAIISHALCLIKYALDNGLVPRITSTSRLYSVGGEDCISPYFGHSMPKMGALRFRSPDDLFFLKLPTSMSLEEASAIFAKYLAPTTRVVQIADSIAQGGFSLSVHYRGTDKSLEAAPVQYSSVMDEAMKVYRGGRIFLATDEPEFEKLFRAHFQDVQTYNLGNPSSLQSGRHFSDMAPGDKALEAAVNMLLLARSPICVRTPSYLSAVSKIINREMETRTIGVTRNGSRIFPERQILASESEVQ